MRFYNTEEIRKAAKGHFFDSDAMRFFDSRVCLDAFDGPGGCYFVTSERFRGFGCPDGPRRYTVRRFNRKTGAITTPDTFQGFKSRNGALAAAKRASLDASPRSAAAWKAARTREVNAAMRAREESNRSHLAWLKHVAKVERMQGRNDAAEVAEARIRQFREDHPSL